MAIGSRTRTDLQVGDLPRRSRRNADGTEDSTSRQEHAIYEYIRANNMGRVVAVYTDIASAYSEKSNRTEFKNALADLQAGRIDGLMAWKVDRLTRRRSEARWLLKMMKEYGGRLATVVEGIDTADPVKRLLTEIALTIYAGAAEAESEAIGERVSLMHLDRARKGWCSAARFDPLVTLMIGSVWSQPKSSCYTRLVSDW